MEDMEIKTLKELACMIEDINHTEIVSHAMDGTFLTWLTGWRLKSQMLVNSLLENSRASAQK